MRKRDADLAVRFEAADPGSVAGARIDDHVGPQRRVDLNAFGRQDLHKRVIDRALERAAVDHHLVKS